MNWFVTLGIIQIQTFMIHYGHAYGSSLSGLQVTDTLINMDGLNVALYLLILLWNVEDFYSAG